MKFFTHQQLLYHSDLQWIEKTCKFGENLFQKIQPAGLPPLTDKNGLTTKSYEKTRLVYILVIFMEKTRQTLHITATQVTDLAQFSAAQRI